jgi:hypothetical protein
MFRKLLQILLVPLLTACVTTPASNSTPTPQGGAFEAEEQAVFAVVLTEQYSAPGYVLMADSATDITGVENTVATLEHVLQNMHSVDPGTAHDFLVRNETATPLRSDMQLGSPFVLLSQSERGKLFSQNRDGWQLFYELHPDAPGITTLSHPGFNASFDQALVYVGTLSGWLAGVGYYFLLIKTNGTWTIDQQVMTWIS